jgi:phage shock protein PspC (stress-responsive transcriptional regulator)
MKKVVNINLGGFPITIDEDAFAHLEQYLAAVDRSFRHLEGHDEILHDIEIRIAELLQEQLKGRAIVSISDVQTVIGIMGKPEDFGEEAAAAGPDSGGARKAHQAEAPPREEAPFSFRPGKKLFRDPEDKIIGGVCSGLAAYFGIPDPVWVRLAFVLLLATGFGLITYIVLLVIVPKAVTSADRLAMRGEPVNISTIADAVEKQFEEISDKLNEIGEDLRRKKK